MAYYMEFYKWSWKTLFRINQLNVLASINSLGVSLQQSKIYFTQIMTPYCVAVCDSKMKKHTKSSKCLPDCSRCLMFLKQFGLDIRLMNLTVMKIALSIAMLACLLLCTHKQAYYSDLYHHSSAKKKQFLSFLIKCQNQNKHCSRTQCHKVSQACFDEHIMSKYNFNWILNAVLKLFFPPMSLRIFTLNRNPAISGSDTHTNTCKGTTRPEHKGLQAFLVFPFLYQVHRGRENPWNNSWYNG